MVETDRPQPLGVSAAVVSNQAGVFDDWQAVLDRHRAHPFRKPIADFNRLAFEQAVEHWSRQGGELILDSGCGVGQSTRLLAARFPQACVIGVDRSADRLTRQLGPVPSNACLIRADLVDFWRLAKAAGWQLQQHFLLYPNPSPKKKDFKLRWHGHPVFPDLLALGGRLECRSNWRIYCEEMALALNYLGFSPQVSALEVTEPLTPFERKYQLSGHELWQLEVNLNAPNPA